MKIEDIQKCKKIALLGFGKEGKSTLTFLKQIGCTDITILDSADLDDSLTENHLCICGPMYLENLEAFDLIIKSVGISPYTNTQLQNFQGKITTATEIFFSNYNGKIIGITGTKGKSTTSSLCHHVLQALGYKVALLGNIGNPALEVLDKEFDYVVYEMSSYMLENFHPKLDIGVLINIFTDHLDWYDGDFGLYKKAKENILRNCNKKIINHSLDGIIEDHLAVESIHYNKRDKDINFHEGSFYIGESPIFTHEGIHLEGEHNMENITCVLSILRALDIELHDIKNILTNFCALPHRLQDIGTYNGIRFIDDAISTTPESTLEALKTYKDSVGTIFLGGTDRGYTFDALIEKIKEYKIKNIVLFPESSEKILGLLDENFNTLETSSMEEAVNFAYKHTLSGEICLLSTASPSYSLWKNFEDQGNEFKQFVITY